MSVAGGAGPGARQDARTAPARTIVGADGQVLLFSCDQFVEDICLGDCCFVCGARPLDKPFNGEHVIPDWVLRRYGMTDRKISLPDGQERTYGAYKIPCCRDCNELLGQRLETPVSKLLDGSFDDIVARLDGRAARMLFVWLCLVFLKTHLKDRQAPKHLDRRLGEGWLSDDYAWEGMHHLHCVARAPYLEAELDPEVLGSLLCFKIEDEAVLDDFGYVDFTYPQTIVLRLGEFGVVAVLNDCGAAQMAWHERLEKIRGPLSITQLHEVGAMLAVANDDLMERPVFGSKVNPASGAVRLWAKPPAMLEFAPFDPEKLGAALAFALRAHSGHLAFEGERDPERVEALIRAGRLSYLWGPGGEFRPADFRWEPVDGSDADSGVRG